MGKKEILEFINQYDENATFGINEDGITLSELKHPQEFLELGGLPEHFYVEGHPSECPHCNAKTDHECLTDKIELHGCKHCEDLYYFHRND